MISSRFAVLSSGLAGMAMAPIPKYREQHFDHFDPRSAQHQHWVEPARTGAGEPERRRDTLAAIPRLRIPEAAFEYA
jgi:hypothetical protein